MNRNRVLAYQTLAAAMIALRLGPASAIADTFGIGPNLFTIDFVSVLNAGNFNDSGAGGGTFSLPYGDVKYGYRIGTYEISQDQIDRATASGLTNVTAGAWLGDRPAANINWYNAAAFVNWLNTSTGHQPAYNLGFSAGWFMNLWPIQDSWDDDPGVAADLNRYRHKDAYYFLPSDDEWYKAAYHKNDGVTANYWDFATASNAVPDGIDFAGDVVFEAVFEEGFTLAQPNPVTNVGIASAYGTYGQNGNVFEWTESALDGSNNVVTENRAVRGGAWNSYDAELHGWASNSAPAVILPAGFRVASIPEPTSATLLFVGCLFTGSLRLSLRGRKYLRPS